MYVLAWRVYMYIPNLGAKLQKKMHLCKFIFIFYADSQYLHKNCAIFSQSKALGTKKTELKELRVT